MGALGFITLPVLIVVWAFSGAALGIRPAPGSSLYDFSMPLVEGDQDWSQTGMSNSRPLAKIARLGLGG